MLMKQNHDDCNQNVKVHSRLLWTSNYGPGKMLRQIVQTNVRYQISLFKLVDVAGTAIAKEYKKTSPPIARERTSRHRSILGGATPSEDVQANSRTRRMTQKMKNLRSLNVLHVPPCKPETR